MKGLGKIAVCLVSGLVLSAGARAQNVASSGNPYGPIVVRNVFGLNPVSPEATPPAESPLKITLNGIMSILGQAQALFKVAPKPGQPGAKEESYVLSEGQRQDDIEVTRIDEKAGVVTFNNHGAVQEIPLANAPALNAPGSARAISNPNFVAPGGIPARFGGGRPGGRSGAQNSNPAMNAIPTRRGSSYPGQTTTPQTQNDIIPRSAEEAELLIVANKLKAQQEGDPALAVYPPTALDAEAGVPSNSAEQPMPTGSPRR